MGQISVDNGSTRMDNVLNSDKGFNGRSNSDKGLIKSDTDRIMSDNVDKDQIGSDKGLCWSDQEPKTDYEANKAYIYLTVYCFVNRGEHTSCRIRGDKQVPEWDHSSGVSTFCQ